MDHRTRARASAHLIDQLEPRRLLSSTLATIDWQGHSVQAIADSYIIQVKTGVDFNAIAAKKGFSNVLSLGGDGFYSFDSSLAPSSLANWGTNNSKVIDIDPNLPVHDDAVPTPSTPAVIPNDTYFQSGAQYNLYNYGQTIDNFYGVPLAGKAGVDIDATQAWTISTGSKTVIVADLDTGADITHPDLVNNIWTNEAEATGTPGLDNDGDGYIDDIHGWNFIANNNDVNDDNGHGTLTAGVIGAQGNNGIGVAGVNWNVSIIPVKVLSASGSGTTASIIEGVEYVTTLKNLWVSSGGKYGANVTAMNLSLGDNLFPYDTLNARAYQQAGAAGILVVTAAGNGLGDDGTGVNLDTTAGFPGKFSLNLPNVITVASVDNQGNLSLFSNFGAESVQVAAPGESITSTYPPDLDVNDGNDDGYTSESGTSFSAPTVTGILALMASVEPTATAAQLKQALFSSVDPLPSLEPLTSTTSGKVSTGGEVNAYKALLAIENAFVQTDTYTKGNWQGYGAGDIYGTSGAYIAGESTTFPAGVTITGGSPDVLADSTKQADKNISALQLVGDPADRIEAGLTSASSIYVNLDLAAPTRVTLYLADYDKQNRSEQVQVIDPATGNSISGEYSQTVSNFSGGEYLTYQLSGNVELSITRLAGPNAILNGLFLDPVTTSVAPDAAATARFVSTNTTASGNFQSSFGSQGVYLPGQSSNFPSFVNVNVSGATTVSGGSKASELENAAGTGTVKSYLTSPSAITLDMNFTDGQVHQTTFYAADSKNAGLAERIEVVDPATGDVLAMQDLSSFKNGAYATFDLSGNVQVRIIRLAGPAAVLGGVFFDAPPGPSVSYAGVDTTTRGNWTGTYGNAADYIIGESTSPLTLGADYNDATATLNVVGAMTQILSTTSKSKTALQLSSGISSTRILSRLIARSSFTIYLDFSDNVTHQLALYLADTDTNNQRSETVEVNSATSSAQQQISDFKDGKYVIFNVRGNVAITITNVRGPNAILNGLFID